MNMPNREESGMALVTVLALGIVMSIWAYALGSLLIPSMTKASQAKHANIMRSTCEATLDWCATNLDSTPSMDDPTANGSPVTTNITNQITLPPGMSARVIVNNTSPPTSSFVYDSTINPAYTWRMVTAEAWYTANPNVRKRVTVILKPLVTYTNAFKFAAFGKSGVTLTGNAGTDSVDTSKSGNTTQNMGGDIAAIGKVTLGSNSVVGGNVTSYSPDTKTSAADMITGGSKVFGTARSHGGVQDALEGKVMNTSNESLPSGKSFTEQDATLVAPDVPTTPTAPPSATNLGALSLSGNKTMTLAPGDYVVSSLSITGNGKLILSGNGPVNIYVQGAGASVSIGGNGIQNSSGLSSNMRIWYSGTNNVQIAGNGNFTGVIFAPNTNVRNVGNGQVTGSIVGNYIDQNGNGFFHYDRALSTVPITIPSLGSYQTVSWRER